MNRTRSIKYGALLVVAFIASAVVGALLGQSRTAAPVANVPTPTPALTASATPTTAPQTPTLAPTPSPSPVSPTTPPTVPPTAPPSHTQTTPPLDPPTVEEFAADLLAAFQTGDTQYLLERLHPTVFERYGEDQCQQHVAGIPADPNAAWTVVSSSGPAPWEWVTDEVSTTIDGTWTVVVAEPETGERDLHFAPSDGTWRWFLDCGDPV